MEDAWKPLNEKVGRAKRTKKDAPQDHRHLQRQQPFTGCIQAAIEMEGRFPFSPKFRTFWWEIKWNGPVRFVQNWSWTFFKVVHFDQSGNLVGPQWSSSVVWYTLCLMFLPQVSKSFYQRWQQSLTHKFEYAIQLWSITSHTVPFTKESLSLGHLPGDVLTYKPPSLLRSPHDNHLWGSCKAFCAHPWPVICQLLAGYVPLALMPKTRIRKH